MSAPGPADAVTVRAAAKLNLFLRVLGRREDGYHDLETLIAPIDLADFVTVHAFADPERFQTLSLELRVSGEPALLEGVPADESNLALRAAAALGDHARIRGFAEISLQKHVPAAAGLGGGSADAAAVLRALNELWGSLLPEEELAEVAMRLGSDIPAMMAGRPVVARGRGERLEEIPVAPFRWAVLTLPFGVSTGEAFTWWDLDGARSGPDPRRVIETAAAGEPERLAPLLFNDLEQPVIHRHPEVGLAKQELLARGALGAVMAGSGSTMAALLPNQGAFDFPGAIEAWSEGSRPGASWPPATRTRISGTKTRRPANWTKGQGRR